MVLRDQVNEILETVPMVPKLDRLTSLLRENEYKPEEEDDDEEEDLYDAPPVSTIEGLRAEPLLITHCLTDYRGNASGSLMTRSEASSKPVTQNSTEDYAKSESCK